MKLRNKTVVLYRGLGRSLNDKQVLTARKIIRNLTCS